MFFCCCAQTDPEANAHSVYLPTGADSDEVTSGGMVKAEAVSASARSAETWEVHLKKAETGTLGVELDIDSQKRLAVKREPQVGPALAWNKSAMNKGFRPGDIVEAVNGVTDEARALLTLMKESDPVTLSMKRLVNYTITIKVVEGLGLAVVDSGGIAKVEAIENGGAVAIYNNTCSAGYRVAQGDWVVSVNGMVRAPRDLILVLDEIGPGPVNLRLGRPRPSDNPGS